jgi:hypothetical protein
MLKEGKIGPEEADRLLGKLSEQESGPGFGRPLHSQSVPKYLHVRVDPKEGEATEHGKVRIRVPLTLIRAGINLAALMPKEVHSKVDSAMEEKGFDFRLSDLDAENIDEILMALKELQVDVDSGNETVNIYCE